MKAILLVGHGSRDHEGNDEVRKFIENLIPKLDSSFIVETCFLEFELPTVNDGIDSCVKRGATHIHLIPLMLLSAGHSKLHIPYAIDVGKEKHPTVQFSYGRPIGIHEATFDICIERLIETDEDVENPSTETAIILLGRGGSDPDANSDLYKISRLLWEKLNYRLVEPSFMGVTNPLLDETIDRCVLLGAKKVVVLPYFLFTGILIKRLEHLVFGEFQKKYPSVQFKLANYFGFHPKLETIVLDRIEESLQGEVKMNCDLCQHRMFAMEHGDHHHHHHDHDHHHHHHGGHNECSHENSHHDHDHRGCCNKEVESLDKDKITTNHHQEVKQS